jgi:hypothetical protein
VNAHTIPARKTGGEVVEVLVDPIDYVWACQYNWHLNEGYAARSQRTRRDGSPEMGKIERIYLHREVMGHKKAPRSSVIDHIDGNRLDCRKSNLRVGDHAMNAQNRKPREGCSSRYHGVHWHEASQRWRAASFMGGTYTLIGWFHDEDEAGTAAEAHFAAHSPYRRLPEAL